MYPDENKIKLNMNESWDSQTNLQAALPKPVLYWCPVQYGRRSGMKTCVMMIKEIADEIRKYQSESIETRTKIFNKLKGKIVIIIIDPKYAVPWAKPIDVSWKDLALGRVEPYKVRGRDGRMYICCLRYEHVLGVYRVITECPNSYEEWEELCGLPKQNDD
ncbi:MAG: hypothetical protein LBH59_06895 [Planctomycetaceae bacterium]|jgi:hypothetical protein|nr:hypothetical protein [Planctomycetaceae bacterium]